MIENGFYEINYKTGPYFHKILGIILKLSTSMIHFLPNADNAETIRKIKIKQIVAYRKMKLITPTNSIEVSDFIGKSVWFSTGGLKNHPGVVNRWVHDMFEIEDSENKKIYWVDIFDIVAFI